MKKIELFTFTYNDQDFLPFFLDYYSFVDRMTFIDSGSTDKTLQIVHRFATSDHPVIRVTQTGLTTWDHAAGHIIRNEIWKDSTYDLVMFPDLDEIFYHPQIVKFLNRKQVIDVYEMEGFEMVGQSLPPIGKSILNIRTGVKFNVYNKSTIFNPQIDICFPNAHLRCTMSTNISAGEIKLLHYRNMGIKMMTWRSERERLRLPKNCKYRTPMDNIQIRQRYEGLRNQAINVI
jgi:glycosyltransferase involved in cell wall biosynthesis